MAGVCSCGHLRWPSGWAKGRPSPLVGPRAGALPAVRMPPPPPPPPPGLPSGRGQGHPEGGRGAFQDFPSGPLVKGRAHCPGLPCLSSTRTPLFAAGTLASFYYSFHLPQRPFMVLWPLQAQSGVWGRILILGYQAGLTQEQNWNWGWVGGAASLCLLSPSSN